MKDSIQQIQQEMLSLQRRQAGHTDTMTLISPAKARKLTSTIGFNKVKAGCLWPIGGAYSNKQLGFSGVHYYILTP
jgi:hypothetical protein